MSNKDLLPCPFCGSSNVRIENSGVYVVRCVDCDTDGPISDSLDGAAALWNRRVDKAQPMYTNAWEDENPKDPNGINPHEPGAKLDAGKPLAGILMDFSLALRAVVDVGTFGARKYSRGGWQHVEDGITRYTDALWRHLLDEGCEQYDRESGLLHAAHLAWNALARLELILRESDND